MIRKYRTLINLLDVVTDVLAVFLSYVLAVYIRYHILRSQPGLNTLSAPYLLLAAVYGIVMASVFSVTQSSGKKDPISSDSDFFKIFSVNAIGCLVLVSFFYIVNVIYFSRWALVLFWVISSAVVIVKKELLRLWLRKWWAKGNHRVRVLIVGDGELAREYISSVTYLAPCSMLEPVGYLGEKKGTSVLAGAGESASEVRRLGRYKDLEKLLDSQNVDEVVFALENEDSKYMRNMLKTVRQKNIMASMIPCFHKYIPSDPVIQEVGDMKLIDLNGNSRENAGKTYTLGLILSVSILLLMMLIRRFGIGELDNFKGYESYKCIFFAIMSFFLLLKTAPHFRGKSFACTKAVLLTGAVCTAAILIYETLYSIGGSAGAAVVSDLRMTFLALLGCWGILGGINFLRKNDIPFIM